MVVAKALEGIGKRQRELQLWQLLHFWHGA